jgi:3'-5' exoribonuclease
MENKKICQFQKGDTIQGFYLIKSVSLKTTASNSRYVDFTLADRTGEINAKLWDYSGDKDLEFTEGTLIKVRGVITEWQNQLQLKIDRIRRPVEEDGVRLEDFVPTAPHEPEDMLGEIIKAMVGMKNRDLREIVSCILNEKKEKLLYYPAAKSNHHALRSGLLYHITTMLKAAEKIWEIYPFLNRDLLYAGVILHDMAKLEEMDASELGIVSDYTKEGMLLGHIIQGIKLIEEAGRRVGAQEESVLLLQHMILSHHYEPEFGSPKRPMVPEGEVLHYLDILDARMYDMGKHLESVERGSFSEKVWLLHNRKLYRADLKDTEEDANLPSSHGGGHA